MAKADFCFTYYDGDATRDMAHMTRLERGAYTDLIIQQRQRGHLTKDDIKRFLSKDFDEVWPSLEWVLKVDGEGKFFIEWLENSVEKAKKHSEKQRNNRFGLTKTKPTNNQNNSLDEPLGDGNGDGNEIEDLKEGGTGETIEQKIDPQSLIGQMTAIWKQANPDTFIDTTDTPALLEIARKIMQWRNIPDLLRDSPNILNHWRDIVNHIRADGHLSKYSITQVNKHFASITQSFKNGSDRKFTQKSSGKSAGAEQLAASLAADLAAIYPGGQ